MKNLLILGAGTAGTIVANRVHRAAPKGWQVTVVDPSATHLYQPGLLFLPFGVGAESKLERPRQRTLASRVHWVREQVKAVDPDKRRVILANGESMPFDLLVIASGSETRPDQTPGMLGDFWYRNIFDFYTLDGARELHGALAGFEEGRLVINVVEMPIKCPVAPMEFAFLADDYFRRRGIRDRVDLVYVTPLDAVFTKPVANALLGDLFERKNIRVETEFMTGEVDGASQVIRSYDEREVPFELLVTIPTHMGASFIEHSGIGDELAFVPTDLHTLAAKEHDNIFVLGDATDLPTSKAGSVAHFQAEVLTKNLLRAMRGESLVEGFDGHANCFVETGRGKGMLIDFNYETEPLPGHYPVPGIGPFSLLKETRPNHWGKLAFQWMYWNMLLPGRPVPVPTKMSMAGKRMVETNKELEQV